jgi:ADP-ribose pyrophosphatase
MLSSVNESASLEKTKSSYPPQSSPRNRKLAKNQQPDPQSPYVTLPANSDLVRVLYIVAMVSSQRSKSKREKSRSNKAQLISSRTVYRGPAFWVTADHVQEPGGVRTRRDIVHHTGSVVVLAVDDSRTIPRVLLERQYRHAANDYLWELPAGRIDPGEKPLPAAQRELLEETGYTASHWRSILNFYASPGFVAETMTVYLATGLRAGEAQPEDDEKIYARMVPLHTAVRMVVGGKIRDAKTISSVLWLNHQVSAKRDLRAGEKRSSGAK